MVTTPDLLAAGPEIFLAVMGMVLMMIGVFSPEKRALGIVSGLTVASFAVVLAYYLFMASGERSVAFAGLFVTDAFAIFMKALVLLGGILVLLMGDLFGNPGLAFLFALLLLTVTKAVKPEDAFSGFGSDLVIAIGLLYVVSAAGRESTLLNYVVRYVLGRPATLRGALCRLVPPVMLASAFMPVFHCSAFFAAMLYS